MTAAAGAPQMGRNVLVVDDREQFLSNERFPEAGFVFVERPAGAAERPGTSPK
jgi:hypothetical protein